MALQEDRQWVINYCKTFADVYEDYPFKDNNWTVIRHQGNRKIFAWIFEKDEHIWVNVKCDTEWINFWREAFTAVVPAFHLNKAHWNSIILDGTILEKDMEMMIANSYELTKK